MFTYIKLKNFLSFGDVTFDFKKNAKTAKSLIAIYGENGSGKSNFVRCFDFLDRTLTSFAFARRTESLTDLLKEEKAAPTNEVIQRILRETDMESYLASCRMIGCDEPTEVEFGFLLDGHEGYYRIIFAEKIIGETLYYFTGKQSGKLFEITSGENGEISDKYWSGFYLSKQAENEFRLDVRKFWGKHTFLGILVQRMHESNTAYIINVLSECILQIIGMFVNTTVAFRGQNFTSISLRENPAYALPSLNRGKITGTDRPILERSERVLRDFFTQAYADIKNVEYKLKITDKNEIEYQLFVDKMIAGQLRHISFENESSGTKQVLRIFETFLGLFDGAIVIYDEIDTGIHDLLMTTIIASLPDEIPGQLIFTTHNTMLLEELSADSVYVIDVDYLGNKEVHCIAEFPVQRTHNKRLQYLKGLYGGTPYLDGIDYDSMMEEFSGEAGEGS